MELGLGDLIEILRSNHPGDIENRLNIMHRINKLIDQNLVSIKDLPSYPLSLFLGELDYSYQQFSERCTRYRLPSSAGSYRGYTYNTCRILWMIGDDNSRRQAIKAMTAMIDFMYDFVSKDPLHLFGTPNKNELMLLEMMESCVAYPLDWPRKVSEWEEEERPKRERMQKQLDRLLTKSGDGKSSCLAIISAVMAIIAILVLFYNKKGDVQKKDDILSRANYSLRNIDFRNYLYFPSLETQKYYNWPKEIRVKDGKFLNQQEGSELEVLDVHYSDLTSDSNEEAIVVTSYSYTGSNYWETDLYIYSVRNGRVILIARLSEADTQRDYNKYYKNNNQTLEGSIWGTINVKTQNAKLIVERYVDGPHCCPENIATMIYRWDGQRMNLQSKPSKRPFEIYDSHK